jgi:Helix-turn-helix domain
LNRGRPDSKDFARARLQAADELRRDGKLSPTARLVGWEIFSCINRANGQAYPSEQTIASRLGVTDKTVKRAIAQLKTASHIKVTRRGRNNVYSQRVFSDLYRPNRGQNVPDYEPPE